MSPIHQKIKDAQRRLRGQAHATPVVTSRTLNEACGANVYLKCENLQRIGAFKFRGAFNMMSQLSAEQKRQGVITFSSGNHGQAVALVGQLLGIKTTVVMPRTAPVTKRDATAGYGAEVVLCEAAERLQVATDIQQRSGCTMVPPFDHEDIIAGQGTVAAEFLDQVPTLDVLLVPCGGGGLLSGCAAAVKNAANNCKVIGVEPELADDATRSFKSKALQTVAGAQTIADGLRTPALGRITFPLILEHVDDFVTVTESAIYDAVKFLFFRTKLVVEPSGVVGVAALLSGALKVQGNVGVVLSGGNIDGPTMTSILTVAR